MRPDNRQPFEMRPLRLTSGFIPAAEGSCLVELGHTRVIVTASIDEAVPPWIAGKGSGWITAEYSMIPRSTRIRSRRASLSSPNSRNLEIQRLIGRSFRSSADLKVLGERTITLDCDVIEADGGTRTASIIGGTVALYKAGEWLLKERKIKKNFLLGFVGAVSAGIAGGEILVDLCFEEDSAAEVDMNIVADENGRIIEIQGTAEKKPFSRDDLTKMLDAAIEPLAAITRIQHEVAGG